MFKNITIIEILKREKEFQLNIATKIFGNYNNVSKGYVNAIDDMLEDINNNITEKDLVNKYITKFRTTDKVINNLIENNLLDNYDEDVEIGIGYNNGIIKVLSFIDPILQCEEEIINKYGSEKLKNILNNY